MTLRVLAVFILVLTTVPGVGAEGARLALNGRWVVTGVAGAQETTSLSSDDADKLKGLELVVTPDSVQFSNARCDKPAFKQTRHNTAGFFRREYKLDPGVLRLPDPVIEIEISCLKPSPISFAYVRDKRHVVVYWQGFFLNAER